MTEERDYLAEAIEIAEGRSMMIAEYRHVLALYQKCQLLEREVEKPS